MNKFNPCIYILKDPITEVAHYIGFTVNPKNRLGQHIENNQGIKEKRIWIGNLKKQGLKPKMEIIAEYDTVEELPEAEEFWYGYFRLIGAEFYNDPNCIGDGLVNNSGEKNGQSRLTEKEVIDIRVDLRSQHTIANEYGVSRSTIADIKCNRTWKYLKTPLINKRNLFGWRKRKKPV